MLVAQGIRVETANTLLADLDAGLVAGGTVVINQDSHRHQNAGVVPCTPPIGETFAYGDVVAHSYIRTDFNIDSGTVIVSRPRVLDQAVAGVDVESKAISVVESSG